MSWSCSFVQFLHVIYLCSILTYFNFIFKNRGNWITLFYILFSKSQNEYPWLMCISQHFYISASLLSRYKLDFLSKIFNVISDFWTQTSKWLQTKKINVIWTVETIDLILRSYRDPGWHTYWDLTWEFSVVIISRQSETSLAFLHWPNPLENIKACNGRDKLLQNCPPTVNLTYGVSQYMRSSSREKVSSARGTSQSRQSSMKQIQTLSAFTSTPDSGGAEWLLESESARLRIDMISAFSHSHVAAWSNWPIIQHTRI